MSEQEKQIKEKKVKKLWTTHDINERKTVIGLSPLGIYLKNSNKER